MKFYDIDENTRTAMDKPESDVRLKIAIDFAGTEEFIDIPEERVLEADLKSFREAAGGVVNGGSLLLENVDGVFSPENYGEYQPGQERYNGPVQEDGRGNLRPGRKVLVSFSVGAGNRFVARFLLYVDEQGFRQELSDCCRDQARVGLVDFSHYLKKTEEAKDWTENEVFTYRRVCDKEQPEESLVHGIAARGKLAAGDIDCCTIDAEIAYLKTTKSVWEELSECARAYRAHLECAVEKALVFAHSMFQREAAETEEVQYELGNGNLIYLHSADAWEEQRNDIRLKWNKSEPKACQRLWSYQDPPVNYAEDLTPSYPFKAAGKKREIESEDVEYTAPYTALGEDGKTRTVLYADELDTQENIEGRMSTSGPGLAIAEYNPNRYPDRAVIRLACSQDCVLEELSIWGRPIVVEPNFACFLRNDESIARHGTRVLNVTGKYFSDTLYDGEPHYRRWTAETLARLVKFRKRYTAKTNRGLFHARVGALVRLKENLLGSGIENRICTIEELGLRYRKDQAFVTRFGLLEA